jgi:hypothetical protein
LKAGLCDPFGKGPGNSPKHHRQMFDGVPSSLIQLFVCVQKCVRCAGNCTGNLLLGWIRCIRFDLFRQSRNCQPQSIATRDFPIQILAQFRRQPESHSEKTHPFIEHPILQRRCKPTRWHNNDTTLSPALCPSGCAFEPWPYDFRPCCIHGKRREQRNRGHDGHQRV